MSEELRVCVCSFDRAFSLIGQLVCEAWPAKPSSELNSYQVGQRIWLRLGDRVVLTLNYLTLQSHV